MTATHDEATARRMLSRLRTTAGDEAAALDRLLTALPGRTRRTRVRRSIVAAAVAAVIVGVFALALSTPRAESQRRPSLISSPPPAARTLSDGLRSPDGLIDVDGALWVNANADHTLVRVDIAAGDAKRVGIRTGSLATLGGQIYVLDPTTGIADVRSSTGTLLRSVNLGSTDGLEPEIIAADGVDSDAGLWTATCCDQSTPVQHLQQRNPTTLDPDASNVDVDINAEGDTGSQLAVGPSGVWFLDPDGASLYQVFGSADGRPTKTFDVQKRLRDNVAANTLATAAGRVVFETSNGALTVLDPVTLAVRQGAPLNDGNAPSSLVVAGDTAYVAFSHRVIAYDLITLKPTSSYPVGEVSALAAGPDGVWAATGGRLVQLTR